jgi:hypothetical protein
MLKTRADVLKYALADALKGAAKIVRGLRTGLTVSEREAIAEQAVAEIRNPRRSVEARRAAAASRLERESTRRWIRKSPMRNGIRP